MSVTPVIPVAQMGWDAENVNPQKVYVLQTIIPVMVAIVT
jgi:hypothetical protein